MPASRGLTTRDENQQAATKSKPVFNHQLFRSSLPASTFIFSLVFLISSSADPSRVGYDWGYGKLDSKFDVRHIFFQQKEIEGINYGATAEKRACLVVYTRHSDLFLYSVLNKVFIF
jgi:hypothetical protein